MVVPVLVASVVDVVEVVEVEEVDDVEVVVGDVVVGSGRVVVVVDVDVDEVVVEVVEVVDVVDVVDVVVVAGNVVVVVVDVVVVVVVVVDVVVVVFGVDDAASDAAPNPFAFSALTVTEYVVPFTSEEATHRNGWGSVTKVEHPKTPFM